MSVAHRYCTSCGAELPEDARFCHSCGRPAHETAALAIPEAQVEVPPAVPNSGETAGGAGTTAITLGIVGLLIALLSSLLAGSPGWTTFFVIVLAVVLYRVFYLPANAGRDTRQVLRTGSEHPIPEPERSRLLDEEVSTYMRSGFFVRQRTATAAQLVKPRVFSFVWAFLWFLVFGVGLVVYLIYYAAKQDEGRYVEVDEYGAVRATRQVRHVL